MSGGGVGKRGSRQVHAAPAASRESGGAGTKQQQQQEEEEEGQQQVQSAALTLSPSMDPARLLASSRAASASLMLRDRLASREARANACCIDSSLRP